MPIYMDRHDVSEEVTAENVAQLHIQDLKVQDRFDCKGLTYWYDDIRKIAFCLVEAPNKESIKEMHNHAHGEIPTQIIEVDKVIVESFLGRIQDPENLTNNDLNIINDPAQRTLMLIQFITISLKIINTSQSETWSQKTIHLISDLLTRFEGQLVKQKEGYLLVSFKSTYNAVRCAIELKNIQKELKERIGNTGIDIRIGLASGMPVTKNKTFFENTIKLAERLCLVDKNKIVVSAEVKNLFITENPNASFDKDKLHALTLLEENFITSLMNFVEEEWQNSELKVDDFGSSLGMSKTLIYRKMMSLTGKSPSNFIKEYRLSQALERINLKMNTISEIAYETGFNSLSYFSKCFQRRFGLLPSDYNNS